MTILCPNGHQNPDSNRFCQGCGTEIIVPISNQMTAGILLGDRYRITAEIGRGGFGRTYLCEDINRFNEPCVLKEFAPQVHGTALLTKAQELFEREAGVMYRLQHPQIPMFREMFRVNRGGVGQLFLVQDYVAGDNYQRILRHKLQQGKTFTEAEVTEFLNQILPVLGYIHSLGVIHRDISPDNLIKRTSDGLPVLIDFGGVKQVAVNAATQYVPTSQQNSDVPTRLGKVGYAPNEQMQRGVVSPHSDLYALAVTTLVLLTGKEPTDLIDSQNFTWNWREHISLSPQLGSMLDRMLQLRPNDRFPSAQDVLAAMKSANLGNVSSTVSTPGSSPVQPALDPKSQVATVVATPNHSSESPSTTVTPTTPGLLAILGKTWIVIAAVVGAIGLGWVVASLTAKRPAPEQSSTIPNAIEPSPIAPEPAPSESTIPTPIASSSPSTPTISSLKPTIPAPLASKGVNAQVYGDAVKQIFISQNPDRKLPSGDSQVQSQLDSIASELGNKLTTHLSKDAVGRIGKYTTAEREQWRSQVNKLKLSERALMDLTDAQYQAITDLSAQKLGLEFKPFLKTPMGQVYLATMFDRVRAIRTKQALGEIIFPVGGTSGTVSGTLQPGEGKAYIASLFGGQDIGVKINANQSTKLSIYPPTSKLPAILTISPTNNWSGKTSVNGYHEFVLVSHSDRPIQYELTLTAADLKPDDTGNNDDRRSPNTDLDKKQPLF